MFEFVCNLNSLKMEKLKLHLTESLGLNERKVRKDKVGFDEDKFSELLNKIQQLADLKKPTPQDNKILNCFKAFDDDKLTRIVKDYMSLGFDDMKRAASIYYWIRTQKYHHEKKRLLGAQTRVIPDDVYQMEIVYAEKYYGEKISLALQTEGIEGARGQDIVILKDYDINTDTHMIHFHNTKLGREYDVPLNKELEIKLIDFIEKHKKEIEEHEHYIFFSENPVKTTGKTHIDQKSLKNIVAKILEDLNLNIVYAKSSDGRDLHLYTLHGHRGHAITRVFKKSGGDMTKARELANHNPGSNSTPMYIETDTKHDLENLV